MTDPILPPPERFQHADLREVPTDQAGVTTAQVVHPTELDRLEALNLISHQQASTGRRLPELAIASGRRTASLSSYSPLGRGGAPDDDELRASDVLRAALRHAGTDVAGVLVDVCIENQPANGRIVSLRKGLDRLMEIWG